ncbi:hypothetical protein TWF730_009080 [Orbilia blumenaviensis]|uniref:Methyltransferase domain-containing protein n=1 Tax=Orbilia blumenaviensis TaxID=1796055 RepID=A0AAV9UYH8_9PEZI
MDPRLEAAIERGFDPQAVYDPDLTEVKEPMKTILEKYSNIPENEVLSHINRLRNRAFSIYPYVCVGSFAFAETKIHLLPCYNEILERIKSGQKFLDLGCGFGQEIRKLVYDGIPSGNTFGVDLHLKFVDLGYELFRDRSSLRTEFIAADILEDASDLVSKLTGQIDIIYAALILHHFTWEQQITVAKRIVSLLCPKPGSMIVGRNVAYRDSNQMDEIAKIQNIKPFHHDQASWERLWQQVQEDSESEWKFETWEQPDDWFESRPLWKDTSYYLCFSFRRL